MNALNISSFIWGIADDVLRDHYVRGKYRDVILPMTVIRRLDAVLEPTKDDVLRMKAHLDGAGITNQDRALRQASREAFYNTSPFRLRDLRSIGKQQQLRANFEAYLDGFSPNVQEILEKFRFRNEVPRLVDDDILGFLIEKFLDSSVNLSPRPVLNADGSVRVPGLDNHSMGTVFEELIRRFSEENNEEAGEHFTPRDVVELMAHLIFKPIAYQVQSTTYLVYDGACGTGGMLTLAEETLDRLARAQGKDVVHPSLRPGGQPGDLRHQQGRPHPQRRRALRPTTSATAPRSPPTPSPPATFDFMLSNPPYGKSWKSDLERMGGKSGITDPRFLVELDGDPDLSLITRSSDGQMIFLANMLSKMKKDAPLGSRIAEVHNGSSLFTGDAGQGESNIRRWIIENDWLEAIIALPLNIFYNTGIATYIWVLSNRKSAPRRGYVQLIDAGAWFRPLRKNLGNKNCELAAADIERIVRRLPRLRRDAAVEDLPQRRLRLPQAERRAPLAPARHRPRPRLQGERVEEAARDLRARPRRAARHPQDSPRRRRARPLARPLPRAARRPAGRGRIRAGPGAARHRTGPPARRGWYRRLPPPRGPALRGGRLVRSRPASRPAMRSALPATSTGRSPCVAPHEIWADIRALERESEGLLGAIMGGAD